MAATYGVRASGVGSVHSQKVPGSFEDAIITITADAAYAAGGYAFGLAQLQTIFGGAYSAIEAVWVVNNWGTDGGTAAAVARYDFTHGKVQAFITGAAVATALEEAPANLASLSGMTCSLLVRFR